METNNFRLYKFKDGEVFGAAVTVGATIYHAIDSGTAGRYNICKSVKGGGMGPMFTSMRGGLTAEAILAAVESAKELADG